MTNINKMRNVGIFAHVDAGKTTTTEHFLYESGLIRSLGSVDAGTAQTDWLDVERERGISVRSATTQFVWKNTFVNLVDTPGHVDFMAEVERSLRVMDGAILIVSAVESVQAQTEVIWQALRKLNIPTLLYINKMDRVGSDAEVVLEDIHRYLSSMAVQIQTPEGKEEEFQGVLELLNNLETRTACTQDLSQLVEKVAEWDEEILEKFVSENVITPAEIKFKLIQLVQESKIFPVLFGASSKGIGVIELMDAIIDYLPAPAGDEEKPLSGIVFKIERDKTMGRMALVRLYNGRVQNRDLVLNTTQGREEKVTQIRKMNGKKVEDAGVLKAGDIAALCGLTSVKIGDILGSSAAVPNQARLAIPLLTVQVNWCQEQDYPAVIAALQELTDEDPLLDLQWLQEERELHLHVMGPIQLEILTSLLKKRFGVDATFGQPSVIYKETPKRAGEGYVAYTMPKPCWAKLRFYLEPGQRGSGLVYHSEVRNEDLLESYQNEVARRVPEALKQGLMGWQVVDLKITLTEGEHHVWHTHPLDFIVATPMAIMNGLAAVGTALLEPMLQFRITVPDEFGGKVLSDLMQMRAEFDSPSIQKGRFIVEGILPVATSLDYPVRLSSVTKGRGSIVTFFTGYQECPPDWIVERQRRGVNPLDQAKYILSARKALS